MSIADKLKTVAQKMPDVYRTGLFKYAPKSTASGETILLKNSAPEPFVSMTPYGHSWQKTTEGKNLFNINNFVEQEGEVLIQDNGFAIMNTQGEGHPNYIWTKTLGELCPLLKDGDEVYLQFEEVNCTGTNEFYLHASGRDWINGTSLVITQADLDANFNVYGMYGQTTIYKNIMVSKENIPFEPYTHGATPNPYYPQPIESATEVKVLGGNLLNLGAEVWSASPSLIYEFDKDTGVYSHTSDVAWGTSRWKVEVEPNTQYCLSASKIAENMYLQISELNADGTLNEYDVLHKDYLSASFETGDITEAIVTIYNNDSPVNNAILQGVMLNIGESALPYEPYKAPQTLTLPTLRGIGEYRDCVDYERKKLVRNTVEYIIDENTEIYRNTNDKEFYCVGVLPYSMTFRQGFCNALKVNTEYDTDVTSILLGANNEFIYLVKNPFWDDSLEDSGLANLKAYLAENPMKIVTYLNEPTETDLTEEEIYAFKRLRANSPNTTIISDAEVEVKFITMTE